MPRFTLFLSALALAVALPCMAMAHPPSVRAADVPSLTVSAKAKAANLAWWKSLGVAPPRGGFVLTHPWAKPWSGRSLVVPAAWIRQSRQVFVQHLRSGTPLMVNAAALRADLPILHVVMEKGYSGWEIAARKGWDWDAWFRKWDAMLAAHGDESIPDGTAFAPWDAYERFQIDSHSGPIVPSVVGHDIHSRSALLASVPQASCSRMETADGTWHPLSPADRSQQPHAVERWNGTALEDASYIVYPSSLGTAKSVTCGGKAIAATPFWSPYAAGVREGLKGLGRSVAALSGGEHGLAVYAALAPDIGYLRLAAFVDVGDEALAKLLHRLPASAGHEKLLVVDLRGNGGGNAPVDLLSRWIPVKQMARQSLQVHKRSCLYPGLWFNLGQMLALQVKPPATEDFRQTMADYTRGLDAPPSVNCPVSFTTVPGQWRYTGHHFVSRWQGGHPRLLVLVDSECGSDCEYMAWLLAQLPGTVIAGSNTYGLIGFTQPGVLLLPHTRVAFDMATSHTDEYGDGRSENGYGLDVDIVLPAEADWSRHSVLALARKLLQPHP